MEAFERESLDARKDEVMLEAMPAGPQDDNDYPFGALLERSAENQRQILESLERLAGVLGNAGDFIAGRTKVIEAMTRAESLRSDLEAYAQCSHALSQELNSKKNVV